VFTGPIVDSHFHVFRRADTPQHVLLSADVVQRDFSLDDYCAAMRPACVVGGIVVQTADLGTGMDELAYIERLPASPLIGRYVSYLPIDRPDACDIVDQLAQHELVAGVRYSQVVDERGAPHDLDRSVRALQALARHGMVYELSVRPWQYEGVVELARRALETRFVIGHLGKPRLTKERQDDWYRGIERLAALPNVYCKISVALEGPRDPPYDPAVIGPLVRHVVETFGFDRLLFGSNFPVNLISVTCQGWLQMLEAFLAHAREADLDKLYRGNAARLYGLTERLN
jgi:L-fuconolactonase